jgi:GST-like protein
VSWRVLGCRGCGNTIVEAALTLAGIPYTREETDYANAEGLAKLLPLNPLGQVPTVVLPDGRVMTETAAIILYIEPTNDPEFLRWLMFIVCAIYPTFTYGDEPQKWTTSGADELQKSTNAHREHLWRYLETVAKGPWFLGEKRSALDLYVAVMTRWRPRREWFANECPKLHAIATAVDADSRLAGVWATNFDG